MPVFRKKAKTTKKVTIRRSCKVCGHRAFQTMHRAKSVELTDDKKMSEFRMKKLAQAKLNRAASTEDDE